MKKAMIGSLVLSLLIFLTGRIMEMKHLRLADFTVLVSCICFSLIFLPTLFMLKAGKASASRYKRNIFRLTRYIILLGIAVFLYKVLWPRKYGSPILKPSADTEYWNLPTGSRIAYSMIAGKDPKKPNPIIYLQGGPGGPILNEKIMLSPLSEDGYDVYLYDQVGCGFSNRLENIRDYTAERHKRDLEEIVKRIGAEKVILIGQSWGAILAVLFIADNPGKVNKAILTGPGPIQPTRVELSKIKAPDSLQLREPYYSNAQGNEKANNCRTRTISLMAVHFGIKLASDKEADDFGSYLNFEVNKSTVSDTSRIKEMKRFGGIGFYSQVMTVASFPQARDPRSKIKNFQNPVLVMKGQYDNQKWGYTREYIDLFPNHQLVIIPQSGHGIYAQQPKLYLKTVREFLNR